MFNLIEIVNLLINIYLTNKYINEMKKNALIGGQVIDTPGGEITLDPPTQADIEAQLLVLKELEEKRKELIILYQKFEDGKLNEEKLKPNGEVINKFESIGSMESTGGSFMFAPNHAKINSENVQKQETHAYTGGLSSGDNFMTAVMLANKKAQVN